MNALTFHGKQTIRYETVFDPRIEDPTDVIVKVHLCAICGSDLHPYHEREKGLDHGTVMGHEFVGEIVDVGREVKSFRKGDRVFSPFTTNCGACFFCQKGLTCRCPAGQLFGWVEDGRGLHGAQAEFVRVPLADATLLRIPEGVLPEEALLLGDVCSTGFFCVDMAEISPNGVYAIIGCGPVGLMAILGARECGAENIYAIDSLPERLQLAQKFGAVPINFQNEDPFEILKDTTEDRGADAVLEMVGSAAAAKMAIQLVRPGGIIATVGVHTEDQMAFSPVEAYHKNLTYKIGRCPARHYMERLLPLVQKSKYDLTAIISHRLPLSHGVEAYKIFDQKHDGCIKVVLMV
jgi:2-desacetyl-2-hydroxyethyl bacteriochlorophyllide A dehydrogenase